MVVTDALFGGGGGNDTLGPEITPLVSESTGKRSEMSRHVNIPGVRLLITRLTVSALVLYGDPRHTPEMPFNRGNGTLAVTGVSGSEGAVYELVS